MLSRAACKIRARHGHLLHSASYRACHVASSPSTPPAGTLVVWNASDKSALAGFAAMNPRLPTVYEELSDPAIDVSLGDQVAAVITEDGGLWTAGRSETFTLGQGESTSSCSTLKRVEALSAVPMAKVVCGEGFMLGLSRDGDVFSWGYGGSWSKPGALGHGGIDSQPEPALVAALEGKQVVDIAAGRSHALAVTADGSCYAWGNGELGRLGNGGHHSELPALVEALEDEMVVSVAAGGNFSMAVTAGGSLWAWGKNEHSQLGLGQQLAMDVNTCENFPTLNDTLVGNCAAVAAGSNQALAISWDKRVFQWGARAFIVPTERAEFTDAADGEHAVSVCAGPGLYGVLTNLGRAYTWGSKVGKGALGVDTQKKSLHPVLLQSLVDAGVSLRCLQLGPQGGAGIIGTPEPLPSPPANLDTGADDLGSATGEKGFFRDLLGL